MSGERFSLLIEAGPGDVPGIVRLRALLKTMWRSYRLRVVEAQDARGSTETRSDDQPRANDGTTKPKRRRKAKAEAVEDDA